MPRLVGRLRPALAVLVASVAVFTVLAVLVHGKGDNRLDHAIYLRVVRHVPARLIDVALHLTDPPFVVVLSLALAAWAVFRRRWDVLVLTVVVPIACVLLTEHVLKPWVNRTDTGYYAFPSGHETGVASFACVAGLVLLSSRAHARAKMVALLVLAADVVGAAVALVGSDYHYATDTVGSLALCLSMTIVVAFGLDAYKQPAVHPGVSSGSPRRTTV